MLDDHSPLADGSLGPALDHDMKQTVADACEVSRRAASARVLYSLASEFQPESVIELGTNVGISAAYLAAAGGHVTTLDVSRYRLRLAERLHRSLGLEINRVQGFFADTLDETVNGIAPVEMAFIDGHHQYRPTLEYFEAIANKAAPGCVFLFDDIRWSTGMKRAWAELRRDPRFEVVADLGGMGIGILRSAGDTGVAG
jgi:predicted O-methyltransferase YrrM